MVKDKEIYKYVIPDGGVLQMPKGAEILKADFQEGRPTIWALVDPDEPDETRKFVIFGTGHSIKGEWDIKYLGTAFSGPFVWHIFEVTYH